MKNNTKLAITILINFFSSIASKDLNKMYWSKICVKLSVQKIPVRVLLVKKKKLSLGLL